MRIVPGVSNAQLQQPYFGAKRQNPPHWNKPIAFKLDKDLTLTEWKKYSESIDEDVSAANASVLNAKSVRQHGAVIVTTGRAFSGAKLVAPFYRNNPVDFWGTTNGFRLFINRHQEPTVDWINRLSLQDEDPKWKKELQTRYHWDLDKLSNTMLTTLMENGFRPVTAYGYQSFDPTRTVWGRPTPKHWQDKIEITQAETVDLSSVNPAEMLLVSFYSDGTSLMFEKQIGELSSEEEAYGKYLSKTIHQSLKEQGIVSRRRVNEYKSTTRRTILHDFVPPIGDGKKLLMKFILENYLPHTKEVVAAGDAFFDGEYMKPHFVTVKHPKSKKQHHVRLNALQVGSAEGLKRLLENVHPRYLQVKAGELSVGLIKTLQTIRERLGLPLSFEDIQPVGPLKRFDPKTETFSPAE